MVYYCHGFKTYLQIIGHSCHQKTESIFPTPGHVWVFWTVSMNRKWQKWHGMTFTASLKRDVQLMPVSVGTLTPRALSQHARCPTTLRPPYGEPKWWNLMETDAHGAPALSDSRCLSCPSPEARHRREGASKTALSSATNAWGTPSKNCSAEPSQPQNWWPK